MRKVALNCLAFPIDPINEENSNMSPLWTSMPDIGRTHGNNAEYLFVDDIDLKQDHSLYN